MTTPDPLPDHDRLWAGVKRGMEAELVTLTPQQWAERTVWVTREGNDGDGEEGKVAKKGLDILWAGAYDGVEYRVLAESSGETSLVYWNPAHERWMLPEATEGEDICGVLARLLQAATSQQGQQGDKLNEGAQAIRDRTKDAVRRLKWKHPIGDYGRGWGDACDAVLRYLSGQAKRYSKPGGLQGRRAAKGKGGK